MTWDQWMILVLSGTGAAFINCGFRPLFRWGQLSCAVASPCWILSTYQHGQFGMMVLTCWVSACYVYGVYKSFWRDGHVKTVAV